VVFESSQVVLIGALYCLAAVAVRLFAQVDE